MNKQYAVINKATGQLFSGFDADKSPMWTNEKAKACAWSDKAGAHQQALLFASFGIRAQQKPVAICVCA